jgi:isopenicillin-N N-acyltransferase like protein
MMLPENRIARIVIKSVSIFLLAIGILLGLFLWRIRVPDPEIHSNKTLQSYKRVKVGPDHYQVGTCWLKKNRYGIWEMYLEGAPYERGLIYGILARELMEKQEVHFVNQIQEMIPSHFFLQILKGFVGWFNRDIYKYVPKENLEEIYGVSKSFSDRFDFVGPKYYRILNYHAAHDIGHALTDLNMVGCTSFSVNNGLSQDSTLLIGRNFDFYMGDAFAEDKLLVFMAPDKGYRFVSYAWAGLTGVVSGMNEKGITVTLNASKSDIPFAAREPISLLAREILQYAGNIDEARRIAARSETFVSESLLIGSAPDKSSAIIEKSPKRMDVFHPASDRLVCANHYQSKAFANDSANIENIHGTDSKFRFDRMSQLMNASRALTVERAAEVLRDKNGLNNKFIGYGNPKSLNQLISHHAVIFKPELRLMWVSTPPYQLGAFICYDLKTAFTDSKMLAPVDSLEIKADSFVNSDDYRKFEAFKLVRQKINKFVMMGVPLELSAEQEKLFISNNSESFFPYLALGDYHHQKKNPEKAVHYYREALKHEVSSANEVNAIRKKIADAEKD